MIIIELLNPIIKKHDILIKNIQAGNTSPNHRFLQDIVELSMEDMSMEKVNEILLDLNNLKCERGLFVTTKMDFECHSFKMTVLYQREYDKTKLEKELERYKGMYREITENKLVKILRWLLLVK